MSVVRGPDGRYASLLDPPTIRVYVRGRFRFASGIVIMRLPFDLPGDPAVQEHVDGAIDSTLRHLARYGWESESDGHGEFEAVLDVAAR